MMGVPPPGARPADEQAVDGWDWEDGDGGRVATLTGSRRWSRGLAVYRRRRGGPVHRRWLTWP